MRLTRTVSGASADDGGVFTLALAGPSVLTVTGVANGRDWDVTLTAAQTTALTPGTYQWVERLTESSVTRTVAQGVATVTPDLFSAAPGEFASRAEQMLAICQTARENILRGEMKLYMVGGRQVQMHTLAEVAREEAYWTAELAREKGGGVRGSLSFTSNTRTAGNPWL